MKPVFVINALSETVARKGSSLTPFVKMADTVFDHNIFDNLDLIVAAGKASGWVIIEGGDGTVQGIISAFFNNLDDIRDMPKFTLLAGGMTNQVAKNIGLKKLSSRKIKDLFKSPCREEKTSLIKISCEDHPDLYGFLFSTGGVPMVTEYTKSKIHSKGIGGSLAVLVGIIKGISGRDATILHPTEVSLNVDDHKMIGSHLGSLVTTLPSLLLGLDPFWGDGNGKLKLTYVEGKPKHLKRHLAGLWLGRKKKDRSTDGLYSFRAERLDYNYTGPIVLDGEVLSIGRNFTVTSTIPVTFIT